MDIAIRSQKLGLLRSNSRADSSPLFDARPAGRGFDDRRDVPRPDAAQAATARSVVQGGTSGDPPARSVAEEGGVGAPLRGASTGALAAGLSPETSCLNLRLSESPTSSAFLSCRFFLLPVFCRRLFGCW